MKARRQNLVERFLNELVEYGGDICTRKEVYQDLRSQDFTHLEADRYAYGLLKKIENKEQQ